MHHLSVRGVGFGRRLDRPAVEAEERDQHSGPELEPGACEAEEIALDSELPRFDEKLPMLAALNAPDPTYQAGL